MAPSRGRGLRPGGVVRALGRLVLLIGFGFAAGLFIGVLSEEPELLAGHLRGEGEAILLAPTGEDTMPAGPAFSERESRRVVDERKAVMQIRSEEKPDSQLPVVAAPRAAQHASSDPRRLWAIQVGAFSDQASARRLAEDLGEKGYPTKLLAAGGQSQRWRVRVQPVRGEASANEIAARLKRVERLPTWVLPMEGSLR